MRSRFLRRWVAWLVEPGHFDRPTRAGLALIAAGVSVAGVFHVPWTVDHGPAASSAVRRWLWDPPPPDPFLGSVYHVSYPQWALQVIASVFFLALIWLLIRNTVRRDRRRRGQCWRCGYELQGLADERCPECGTRPTHDAPPIVVRSPSRRG